MKSLEKFLKESKFCTVALPEPGIEPLQVLVKRQGTYERLPDKVHKLFVRGDETGLPVVKMNQRLPNIEGSLTVTSDLQASTGLLSDLMKQLGLDFDAHLKAESNDKLVFAYEAPRKDFVSSHVDLDAFLNDAQVKKGTQFGDMLLNSDIYIITETLKTTNLSVGIVDKNKLDAGAKISVKELAEGELTYDRKREHKRGLVYVGEQPVVFAVKVARLKYDRSLLDRLFGKKGVFRIIDAPVVVVKGEEDIIVEFLEEDGLLIKPEQ